MSGPERKEGREGPGRAEREEREVREGEDEEIGRDEDDEVEDAADDALLLEVDGERVEVRDELTAAAAGCDLLVIAGLAFESVFVLVREERLDEEEVALATG